MSAIADEPGCHPVMAAISAARATMADFVDLPLWTMRERDLPGAVSAALALVAQANSVLVQVIGEADDRRIAKTQGTPSTVGWLRDQHNLHPGDAAQLVRTAAAFRTGLTATRDALDAGEISLAHAHGIRRAFAELPDGLHPDLAASVEATLIGHAHHHDPVLAGRLARHTLAHVDPDGQDARDGDRLARAEKRAAANNQITFTPDGNGGIFLRGRLDADGHAIIDTAIQPLMAPRGDTGEGPDLRTIDRRCADALVELCRRLLAGGDLPSHGGSKPQVVVTIPLKTLTDGLGAGTLPPVSRSPRQRRGTGRAMRGSSPPSSTATPGPWTSPTRNHSSTADCAEH